MRQFIKTVIRRLADASGLRQDLNEVTAQVSRISRRIDCVDRGTQLLLGLKYRELACRGVICPFDAVEFRSFSQNGEDGILWYLFNVIRTTNKQCVEICAGNGQECNTANLIINHGWTGLLFDGNLENVERGRHFYKSHPDTCLFPPKFIHAWITAENVNPLLRANGVEGEVDLLSLDIDGVDYWIWNAIEAISPRVVIAEIQTIWGDERAVTIPYHPDFRGQTSNGFGVYLGASLPAFVKLARKKGYRLIGCQRYGFNAVFVRNEIAPNIFPEVSASECLRHPLAKWARNEFRPLVTDKEWVEV